MGAKDGFLNYNRETPSSRDPQVRLGDYQEIYTPFSENQLHNQAARCMTVEFLFVTTAAHLEM
jgi:glutamate synthase (NADPH/NADH) small chain